jgi:hypothetical protein
MSGNIPQELLDRLARTEEQLALSEERATTLARANTEYNDNHAIALLETHGQLVAIQQENVFQTALLKAERKLHVVAHAGTKQRAARYSLLCCRLQYASILLKTFPELSADQRAQLEQHIDAALRGVSLMLTSCTVMDDPSYSRNEPLATYLADGYLHNMFGAGTCLPLDSKYASHDFMAIDEKIERKLLEKAPAELKDKPAKEVAVVHPVMQPVLPHYPYPFHLPTPPANPPQQNQQHHQHQPHQDAPRGGWQQKRPKVHIRCYDSVTRQSYQGCFFCPAVIPGLCCIPGSHTRVVLYTRQS